MKIKCRYTNRKGQEFDVRKAGYESIEKLIEHLKHNPTSLRPCGKCEESIGGIWVEKAWCTGERNYRKKPCKYLAEVIQD